jgi:hypothetical protein
MGASTWNESRLLRVARSGGLERRRNGLFGAAGAPGAWHVDHTTQGWLTLRRAFNLGEGNDALAVHASWVGPRKLVVGPQGIEERVDFFLGTPWTGEDDPALDSEAASVLERLASGLIQRFCNQGQEASGERWVPPDQHQLSAWLHLAACETAVDADQNLRITLKRRGCDGQVRIERTGSRLRYVLPLGRWKELGDASRRAMRELCREANAGTRLVRVAWLASEGEQRCEAQVDLSELPLTPAHPHVEMIWREMTRLAVGGLELVLRRLGLELGVLVDPAHHDLVAAINEVSA